jgi:hypothetical protein
VIDIDPQQEIFIAIRTAIKNLGYDVFDTVLPPENTPYPFVYIGYAQQLDTRTKTQIIGEVHQRIDVWHSNPERRGDVSEMMMKIKQACRAIRHTANRSVDVTLENQTISEDKSTGITLMRGMLEFKINFS